MLQADLSTVITYNPWALSRDTTLAELVNLSAHADLHYWPVVDEERHLLGIVSDSDLVPALAELAAAAELNDDVTTRSALLESCRVTDIMSRAGQSITHDSAPSEALDMLLDNRIHALPVVENEQLIALATSGDFLREFSYGSFRGSRQTASEAMESPGDGIEADVTLDAAIRALDVSGRHYGGVLQGDFALGAVSRRELRVARCRQSINEVFDDRFQLDGPQTLSELVASSPTIRPGERLSEAARLLLEESRHAVAVVNQGGRLLGLITEDGILRAMRESM